jgi:hypothetical protein
MRRLRAVAPVASSSRAARRALGERLDANLEEQLVRRAQLLVSDEAPPLA